MKHFWIGSLVWVAVVAMSAPRLIEAADRRGVGLVVPGLSVTSSEILVAALLAFGPPLAAFFWLRRQRAAT